MANNPLRDLFTQSRHDQLSSRIDLIERVLETIVGGEQGPQPDPWELARLRGVGPRHGPVVDPAATDEVRLRATLHRPVGRGGPVVDPAPSDEARLRATLRRPGPVVDPGPEDEARLRAAFRRGGPVVDPGPEDPTRLTAAELQAELHTISAEKIRLEAREREVQQRLDEIKQAAAPKAEG
jgi:hypothetical protein